MVYLSFFALNSTISNGEESAMPIMDYCSHFLYFCPESFVLESQTPCLKSLFLALLNT